MNCFVLTTRVKDKAFDLSLQVDDEVNFFGLWMPTSGNWHLRPEGRQHFGAGCRLHEGCPLLHAALSCLQHPCRGVQAPRHVVAARESSRLSGEMKGLILWFLELPIAYAKCIESFLNPTP